MADFMQMSLQDILEKPGFKGLPDEEKRKVLTKRFPKYALLPSVEQNKVFQKGPSLLERAAGRVAGGYITNVMNTPMEIGGELTGAGQVGAKVLRSVRERAFPVSAVPITPQERATWERLTTARKPSEQRGQVLGETGLFAAPELAGLRLPETANLLARAGTEAGKAGLISGLETGFKQPGTMGWSAAIGGAFPLAGWAIPKLAYGASEILGLTTGAGGEAIRTIAKNATPEAKEAMRAGGPQEAKIIKNVRDMVERVRAKRGAAYNRELAALPQKTLNAVGPVQNNVVKSLRSDWGIPVTRKKIPLPGGGFMDGGWEADFSGSVLANNPGDQQRVLNLLTTLDNWPNHTTAGIDRLKQTIDDLYKESSRARPIIQKAKSQVRDILNREVPGYQKMTQDYATATKLISDFQREFSVTPQSADGSMIRKLAYSLNQNNRYRQLLIDAFDEAAGTDLRGQVAGGALREKLPRGLVSRLNFRELLSAGGLGFLALHGLGPEVAMGVTADLLASSPRVVGEFMAMISGLRNSQLLPAVGAGTRAAAPAVPVALQGQQ